MKTVILVLALIGLTVNATSQSDYLKTHRYWAGAKWYSRYIFFENDSLVRFSLPYGYSGFNEYTISDKGIVSFHGDTLSINRKFEKPKIFNVYAEEYKQPGNGTTIHFKSLDTQDSLTIIVWDDNHALVKKISIKSWDDSVFVECRENYSFVFSRKCCPNERVTILSKHLLNKRTTIRSWTGHQVSSGLWKILVVKNDVGVTLIGPLLGDHEKRNRQRWMNQFIYQWPWKWTKLSEEHLYDPLKIVLIPSDTVYPFVFEDMETFVVP